MRTESALTEACRRYAAAYAAQYAQHGWPLAFRLYRELLASHPKDPQADYSRMQIQNIAIAVVPKQTLLDAQMELVLARFEQDREMQQRPIHRAGAATKQRRERLFCPL